MIKKLFGSQLRINMISGSLVMAINVTVLAAAYPIYLHFLGYEQYGVWLVLSTVLSFAQLGNLGISQAVMKLVAEEYGRNDLTAVQQYVMSALIVLIISGVLVLSLILLFKTPIVALFKLSHENAKTALWLLPYVGGLSIYVLVGQALNATLSGLGRMDLANYIQVVGRFISIGLSTGLLYSGCRTEGLLVGNFASWFFVHVVSSFCIRHILGSGHLFSFRISTARVKQLIVFGSGILGGGLANILLNTFNKVVLSRFAGISTIPTYDIAFTGTVQIKTLAESALRPFLPEISRLSGHGTLPAIQRIKKLNRAALKLVIGVGLPFYVTLFAFTTLLLRLWLGDKSSADISSAFRLMLIVTFVMLVGTPAYHTLLGMGLARSTFMATLIISGGNCILVLATVLLGRSPSVNSIFTGLIFVSLLSVIYLMSKASKEAERRWYACQQ